jgi:lipoprotein-anchoring transpeptidase ErfK/SrfK
MCPANLGRLAVSALAATILFSAAGNAEPLAMNEPNSFPGSIFDQIFRDPAQQAAPVQAAPAQAAPDAGMSEQAQDSMLPERFRREIDALNTSEAPGTIIIDTPHTYLYYVLGGGRAIRYGIGVGRDGFRWSGVQAIADKQEWPDWHPPAEMIARQPYLPRMMAGGPGNPLGARAMYLGHTEYRIHGTNDPSTIGKRVSSGCIRLTNEDVEDLYSRVTIGTKVVVLPDTSTSAQRQVREDVAQANDRPNNRPLVWRRGAPALSTIAQHTQTYGSTASRLY